VSYLVLARKYRPQTFEDLVGQEHVARTLANAIAQGRVAHAFLFTGVRGVGKTTSARLLAKCLSCVGKDGTATGPTATPCQECAPCKEIAAGSDMDVQEIDGASYNGVDEVRRLQEGLAFRPARNRYKIYIVDEVHMLSTAAWNAFLKTLEEPPPHVKFIFATTEVHKVPVTILSRCQRYDFKLIPAQLVATRLRDVLAKEGISADDGAISILAREAAGSMRDAMSLLDQVIAFGGAKLTAEDVSRVLGVADRKVLHDLAAALVGGDAGRALRIVAAMAEQGYDLAHVSKDLLAHLRNLVVARTLGDDSRPLLDLADEEARDVLALARAAEPDDLVRLFHGFSRAFDDVVRSGQVRATLEVTLVRLARRPPLLPLDELLARVGELERRLGGAPAPPPRGGGGGSSRSATSIEPGPAFSAPPAVVDRSGPSRPVALAPRGDAAVAIRAHETTPTPASVTRPAPPPPAATTNVVRMAPAPDPRALATFRAVIARVRAVRPHLAAFLEHAYVLAAGREELRIGFEAGSLAGDQVREPEEFAILEREARAELGPHVRVVVDANVRGAPSATVAAIGAEKRASELAAARAAVEAHPLVRKVIELFDAEVREVKVPEPEE
jgi:DNA polymerase-3 subunit gamma/tau